MAVSGADCGRIIALACHSGFGAQQSTPPPCDPPQRDSKNEAFAPTKTHSLPKKVTTSPCAVRSVPTTLPLSITLAGHAGDAIHRQDVGGLGSLVTVLHEVGVFRSIVVVAMQDRDGAKAGFSEE